MIGYNCDIETQKQLLHRILSENKSLYEVIMKAQKLGLEKYYIGAGCICQTVWNYQNGLDLMYGISDIDIVYCGMRSILDIRVNHIVLWKKRLTHGRQRRQLLEYGWKMKSW